ncbi:PIG-L deacetylase family protein [Streptomyces sp. NPDC007088]|uniref:PIG-L deacetylase family protein n=1 Tax=Streptomyces sp. NPDC007088 TaxID=3364773 RepID=UPI003691B854
MTTTDPRRTAAAQSIDAPGTPEARWAAWAALAALPAVSLPPGPVVVVSAHPDDEVLGVGGTLAGLAASGAEVHLVTATDGEGSHPGSVHLTPRALAARRSEELDRALDALGLDLGRVHRAGIPDTAVAAHEDRLTDVLSALLRTTGAALCLAPWDGDLHADHEAAGRAATRAARRTGTRCAHYPVWLWHWAVPDDPRVPWASAARLPLDAGALERKRRALEHFVTQTAPLGPGEDTVILPPEELAHHIRPFEVIFS